MKTILTTLAIVLPLVATQAQSLDAAIAAEALRGATQNAARAVGLTDRGTITAGLLAHLAVWDVQHPAELAYRIGYNPLHSRIFGGSA